MNFALPHAFFSTGASGLYDVSRSGVQFILVQPWFGELAEEMKQRIANGIYTIQADKGGVLLRAGEEVGGWYAVLSGLVKLQSQTAPGRRQGFIGIPGGEWFGEGSVMKRGPRLYDVVALRDSELLCLPREIFEELYETNLVFNRTLAQCLNMRLGQALLVIESMRLRSPAQRLALYLGPMLWPRRA